MQWRGRSGSGNIVDRRGGGGGMIGGGIGALVIGLLAYFLGVDPESLPPEVTGGGQAQEQQIPANDSLAQFVSVVLKETDTLESNDFYLPLLRFRCVLAPPLQYAHPRSAYVLT